MAVVSTSSSWPGEHSDDTNRSSDERAAEWPAWSYVALPSAEQQLRGVRADVERILSQLPGSQLRAQLWIRHTTQRQRNQRRDEARQKLRRERKSSRQTPGTRSLRRGNTRAERRSRRGAIRSTAVDDLLHLWRQHTDPHYLDCHDQPDDEWPSD